MTARHLILSAALIAAGCGGAEKPAAPAAVAGPAILAAPVEPTSFADVQQRVSALYKTHGDDLKSYTFQNVRYTPATRDKVLDTCKSAGPTDGVAGLASTKAVGCAPLIFYYYNYGSHSGVPASIALAQRLYWFAMSHERGPQGAKASLTALLRGWGVN